MFDGIKHFEMKPKIFKFDFDDDALASQTHNNTWLILKFMINQTFRVLKYNFQASVMQQ